MIGVAHGAGTTTCIGVAIASGSMAGAEIPATPTFGLGIGIASAATTTCIGERIATVASVVGAGPVVGNRSPQGSKQWLGVMCKEFCHPLMMALYDVRV